MKYIDQHMHTVASPDAYPSASINNYIKHANTLNQRGLMLTDHVDIDSPVPMFFRYPNYDEYFANVEELNKSSNIPIYTGVEVGYQKASIQKLSTFINRYPFDLVICSIHVVDGLDFYYGDFFTGKTIDESINRYFEAVLDAVESYSDYDVFGHIDYITRYIKELDNYDFYQYEDIITRILKTIIRNNKGIEINTSKGSNKVFPSLKLLKKYKQLGGEILTIGSDAHKPEALQQNFNKALKVAKEAGFETIYTFISRNPIPWSINNLL